MKEWLSASTSKDSPRPPRPPLYLIKLIQSGACVRSPAHYLRLSCPGLPLTPLTPTEPVAVLCQHLQQGEPSCITPTLWREQLVRA